MQCVDGAEKLLVDRTTLCPLVDDSTCVPVGVEDCCTVYDCSSAYTERLLRKTFFTHPRIAFSADLRFTTRAGEGVGRFCPLPPPIFPDISKTAACSATILSKPALDSITHLVSKF